MKNKTKFIGVSGCATCGKDFFASLLIEELQSKGFSAQRFALAKPLKAMARQPLLELSNIDILNCTKEEKEIVRPYLVAVGKIKRSLTQGKYWTNIAQEHIDDTNVDFAIITDCRYDFYPEDEVFWVKEKNQGILVHVARTNRGNPILPANEDERENDPLLIKKSDYTFSWETCWGDRTEPRKEVERFLNNKAFQKLC